MRINPGRVTVRTQGRSRALGSIDSAACASGDAAACTRYYATQYQTGVKPTTTAPAAAPTANRPSSFSPIYATPGVPVAPIGTARGDCTLINGQPDPMVRECDPYTGSLHYEYILPGGPTGNANILTYNQASNQFNYVGPPGVNVATNLSPVYSGKSSGGGAAPPGSTATTYIMLPTQTQTQPAATPASTADTAAKAAAADTAAKAAAADAATKAAAAAAAAKAAAEVAAASQTQADANAAAAAAAAAAQAKADAAAAAGGAAQEIGTAGGVFAQPVAAYLPAAIAAALPASVTSQPVWIYAAAAAAGLYFYTTKGKRK